MQKTLFSLKLFISNATSGQISLTSYMSFALLIFAIIQPDILINGGGDVVITTSAFPTENTANIDVIAKLKLLNIRIAVDFLYIRIVGA